MLLRVKLIVGISQNVWQGRAIPVAGNSERLVWSNSWFGDSNVEQISGNILSIGYGSVCGWPSASFPILQSDETPLATGPLTIEEASWVASLMAIGGALGNLLFGILSERLGGKKLLLTAAMIQSVGKLCFLF